MSTEDTKFGTTSGEEYSDVPTGGGSRGFIGLATMAQRWQVAFLKDATEVDGVTYPKGPVYVKGTKEQAEEIMNKIGQAGFCGYWESVDGTVIPPTYLIEY